MAEHNHQHGRRPHFHRGRRGADRRGSDRRLTQREQSPEAGPREGARDGGVDVEQVMREIRSRIAQRHGIELSTQQIQELAARRLDAILEPRNVNPQLLEQLRKSAGAAPDVPSSPAVETFEFEDSTLYDTHRGLLAFIRRLLNPILKLFFNPAPLIGALHTQARINRELAARELERERRQSEWNALQYELVQRVVLEMSRISIEMQALSNRVESLGAKVDFNERRVRSLETVPSGSAPRPQPRIQEPVAASATAFDAVTPEQPPAGDASGEGTRRRRRRRRGRRGTPGTAEGTAASGAAVLDGDADNDLAEGEEDDVNGEPPAAAPEPATPAASAPTSDAAAAEAVLPSPPRDEPAPADPVDHAEPGPVDR